MLQGAMEIQPSSHPADGTELVLKYHHGSSKMHRADPFELPLVASNTSCKMLELAQAWCLRISCLKIKARDVAVALLGARYSLKCSLVDTHKADPYLQPCAESNDSILKAFV
jgi:hypothetical protein